MKRKLLLVCLVVMVISCSKNSDFTPPVSNEVEQQAKIVDGDTEVTIDPTHTWNMVKQHTLTVTNLPADFQTKQVLIMDANPFATESAAILGYSDDVQSAIAYEAPSYMTKLYVACVNDQQMKVRAFDVNEGRVDFQAEQTMLNTQKSAPRRAAANLDFKPTLNATLFDDWTDEIAQVDGGSETMSFTNFSDYASTFRGFLPEGTTNNRKLAAYDNILQCYRAIVADDNGMVAVVPVHKESINSQCLGYYYFLPGETHDIKSVKKYFFPAISKIDDDQDVCTQPVLRLQYFDKEGNASYQFPKGTEIYFFLHVDQTTYNGKLRDAIGSGTHMDWYAEGAVNLPLSNYLKGLGYGTGAGHEDGWSEFSHVVMFSRNDELFVGMEDWVKDFDYNDIIFMVKGDVEAFPESDVTVPTHTHIYTYAFEDTHNGDYDLNDVVLQVKRIYGGNNQEVRLVALGAHDRLFAFYKDEKGNVKSLFSGKELHEALGVEQSDFVNTEKLTLALDQVPKTAIDKFQFDYKTFLYSKADFYIVNETKNLEIHIPTAIGTVGSNPYGVCVPYAWAWPKERVSVISAYTYFKGFAENQQMNTDWYNTPVDGKIIK